MIFVYFSLPTHNKCTMDPLIIVLVLEDVDCVYYCYSVSRSSEAQNTSERGIIKNTTYVDDSSHNEYLTLGSAIWLVEFSLLVNCYQGLCS